MVRERFDRHGEEVVAIVFAAALQPSRTRDLAGRLGLEPPRGLERFLDALAALVRAKGPGAVLTAARITGRSGRDASLEEKFRRIVAFAEPPARDVPSLPPARGFPLPTSRGSAAEPHAHPRNLPPEQFAPPVASRPSLPSEEVRLPETEIDESAEVRPWIRVPGYEGPDRRRIHERRFHPDRRRNAAAIDRNRRFGGDRRQVTRGRRAEDGARPSHWWRYIGDPDQERVLPFLRDLRPGGR